MLILPLDGWQQDLFLIGYNLEANGVEIRWTRSMPAEGDPHLSFEYTQWMRASWVL
jgi:hypothetical protein